MCPPASSKGAKVYAPRILSTGAGAENSIPFRATPRVEGAELPGPPGPVANNVELS